MHDNPGPAATHVQKTMPATFPLALAVWLAVVAAVLELVFRAAGYLWFGRMFRAGLDALWMIPISNLIWFGSAAAVLSLASRRWPQRVSPQIVVTVLGFVLFAGLVWLFPNLHKKASTILALGAAVQAGRMAASRFGAIDRRVRQTVAWPIVAMALALVGVIGGRWGWERWRIASLPQPSQASSGPTSIVLLVLDTVRSFNFSLYGYEKPTTPNLERWAERGVRFDRAFVTAPWTFPSHATMFTGRYPNEMRMASLRDVGWKHRLSKESPTLAEVLSSNGYATGGFVGNLAFTSWEYGFNRGFVHYEDYTVTPRTFLASSVIGRRLTDSERVKRLIGARSGFSRRPTADITKSVLSWLEKVDGRPFFVFVNLFDAHGPLFPPAPFDTLFGPRNPRTRISSDLEFGEGAATTRERMSSYDGAIAYMDQQIDLLMKEMQRRGLLENTLVIVTSDHGEHWGDHNRFSHGNSLYRQLLQVPLVFWHSSRFPTATVVTDPVSLRDLPATILDMVGVQNRGRMLGVSLAGHIKAAGSAQPSERQAGSPILAMSENVDVAKLVSIIADGKHYVIHAGKEELYDADSDPLDTLNLVETPAGQAALPAFRATVDSIKRADSTRRRAPATSQ
ncbi:MAG: sulfatase [Gemmatimonadaceae bacterium]|nr:sulfatase [Gemmatimonadaceae bacterium]